MSSQEGDESNNIELTAEVSQQALRTAFDAQDTQKTGKLDADKVKALFESFGILQYDAAIRKNLLRLAYYRSLDLQLFKSYATLPEQQFETRFNENQLSFEQVKYLSHLFHRPINMAVWKKTCTVLAALLELTYQTKAHYPVKDRGHRGRVKILIGDKKEAYSSQIHLNLRKRSVKEKQNNLEDNFKMRITFNTGNQEQSQIFAACWKFFYGMMLQFIQSENDVMMSMVKQIKIDTLVLPNCFQINASSECKQLNELMKLFTEVLDRLFRTQVLFEIDLLLESDFDLSKFAKDSNTSVYELLTNNLRISFMYKASRFLTALKEVLLHHKKFNDLSYDKTDSGTLILIAVVSLYECDLNLRFKTPVQLLKSAEDMTNAMLETLQQARQMLQGMPEVQEQFSRFLQLLTRKISVKAQIGNVFIELEMVLNGISDFVLKHSAMFNQNKLGQNQQQSERNASEQQSQSGQVNRSQKEGDAYSKGEQPRQAQQERASKRDDSDDD